MRRVTNAFFLAGLAFAANAQAVEPLLHSSASVYWKMPLHAFALDDTYSYGVRLQTSEEPLTPFPSIWWRKPATAEFEFGRNGLEVLRVKGLQVFGKLPFVSPEPIEPPDADFRLFPHGSFPGH